MSNDKSLHLSSGSATEAGAAAWLQRNGLILIERNYRCRGGEIDLIMRERTTLVFVEVRLRTRSDFGGAAASVTRTKQRKLILAAKYFLAAHPRWQNSACRFDVIAASICDGAPQWEWLPAAFATD